MKKRFTVIGIYADNNQPWMARTFAVDGPSAAANAIKAMTKTEDKPDEDDLLVVEAIAGWHLGCLGNDSVLDKTGVWATPQPPPNRR
jgi:hypothetical protein